jgi:hypothetical protein
MLECLPSTDVHSDGWIPVGQVVTLPLSVLEHCRWPAPPRAESLLLVTENPIIGSAAAGASAAFPVRVLCTAGNPRAGGRGPSRAAAGWSVAVPARRTCRRCPCPAVSPTSPVPGATSLGSNTNARYGGIDGWRHDRSAVAAAVALGMVNAGWTFPEFLAAAQD